jgi:3-oxoacyl-[acyl-carrier protein] reductase
MRLEGKVAIVTASAGAGIGQGIVRRLADEGAMVVVSDSHEKRTIKVADEIKSSGRKAIGVPCDVTDREQVEALVKATLDEFGQIDILVNNAGINKLSKVVDMPDDVWELVMNVNLRGTFYCSRAVLPTMIEKNYGRIINISSYVGYTGSGEGQAPYCAAKAGIMAFTKSLAREVAENQITVNAIAPGFIYNEFLARIYSEEQLEQKKKGIPVGRVGKPSDIARAVLFLASDDAGYITGETLCVSGGMYMP